METPAVRGVDLISEGDRDLADQLLRDLTVREAIARLDRAGGAQDGARRQLLGNAVRLSSRLAPDVHELVARCGTALGLQVHVETYVYPGPFFNAAAVRPGGDRFLLLMSSSLLEAFDADELAFVAGHEMGHWLFQHHRIPVGPLLGGESPVGAALALRLFAWQRYAEISADRAGVVCAGGLEPAARALFKLASGLRGERVRIRIDEFLSQYSDLQEETARSAGSGEPMRPDWFATHPFSPLRLRAAELFAGSVLMTPGGAPRVELESAVQDLMTVMEPGYLKERSAVAEAMRRLLFAGGVAIASASGALEESAVSELEKLLGPGSLPFELKPEVILRDLPARVREVRETVPLLRRAQVLRDLCLIARADGRVSPAEQDVLRGLALDLGVDPSLVICTMDAPSRMQLAQSPPDPRGGRNAGQDAGPSAGATPAVPASKRPARSAPSKAGPDGPPATGRRGKSAS